MRTLLCKGMETIKPGKKNDTVWVVPMCEDSTFYTEKSLRDLVEKAKTAATFQGKREKNLVLYGVAEVHAQAVVFMGLGKQKEMILEDFRKAAGNAVKQCIKLEKSHVVMAVPDAKDLPISGDLILKAMMEGGLLANHIFDAYKGKKDKKPLQQIYFYVTPEMEKNNRHLPQQVATVCDGTVLAGKWVSMPSNDKRPLAFAQMIKKEAAKEGLGVTIISEKQLRQQHFGGLLAVGAGSESPPCMVILEYKVPKAAKTVVFVGKGVTFDSGGISLKPAANMDEMKSDMAGAAAAAASLITVAKLKPAWNVVGIMPLVENMPSGSATRPGDIITMYNGKTVEIGNTDAEGRLILADALAYAVKKYKPHVLLDMATLTGACVVALGDKIAGVFSKDPELANAIVAAGERTHERCWHLPLPEDYKKLLKSEFADISNMSSSRYGGAISAALFLSHFTGDTRWAHIDIAGPAYVQKPDAYYNAGGTGFGVRLFWEVLDKL